MARRRWPSWWAARCARQSWIRFGHGVTGLRLYGDGGRYGQRRYSPWRCEHRRGRTPVEWRCHPGRGIAATGCGDATDGELRAVCRPSTTARRAFTFRLQFSEPVGVGYATLRDQSLAASGGTVTRAKRVDGRNDLWEIEVEPAGAAGITVTLTGGRALRHDGARCARAGADPQTAPRTARQRRFRARRTSR